MIAGQLLQEVWPRLDAGEIRPQIDTVLELDQVRPIAPRAWRCLRGFAERWVWPGGVARCGVAGDGGARADGELDAHGQDHAARVQPTMIITIRLVRGARMRVV